MSVSESSVIPAYPERVVRIGGAIMLVLLLMPLAFWLQKSLSADSAVPHCDDGAVLKQVRAATATGQPVGSAEVIRDIHSVGFDAQIGHRICVATLGEGSAARQLKFAISHADSPRHLLRVEAVSD